MLGLRHGKSRLVGDRNGNLINWEWYRIKLSIVAKVGVGDTVERVKELNERHGWSCRLVGKSVFSTSAPNREY
jgi:hypothetical protein